MTESPVFAPEPSPTRDDSVQPMSLFTAGVWVVGATLGFFLLGTTLMALRESIVRNHAVMVGTQACVYGVTIALLKRVYAPRASVLSLLAMRGTHLGFLPLAALLGSSSAVWASWLLERIERQFPRNRSAYDLAESFFASGPRERIAMAVAIVVVGPLVEELLFRGALFAAMGKRHRTSTVIVASAAIFSFVHVEPTVIAPIFMLGLVMGYLRAATGSIWPPLLFHLSFNGTQIADLYFAGRPPAANAPSDGLPRWLMLSALALFAVAFFACAWLAEYGDRARRARQAAEEA